MGGVERGGGVTPFQFRNWTFPRKGKCVIMNNIITIVMYRELTVARQTDRQTDRFSYRGASLLKSSAILF